MKDFGDIKHLKTNIIFQTQDLEEEVFHQDDLMEMFPYGLNIDSTRPTLLLKDESHHYTLPVALNPLEAGMTLNQSQNQHTPNGPNPHRFLQALMENLQVEIKQCVFVEIKGAHQYVRLYLSGHPSLTSLKIRADEAMSLCVHFRIPIFASKAFIGKSLVMTAQVENGGHGLGALNVSLLEKKPPFLM